MEFWLKQGEEALQLPVKPSEFNVTVAHRNTVVNVIQLGDINLMGKTGLREIALSSFFPDKDYHFSNNFGRKKPIACVNQLEGWRKSGKPVRVIITDLLNMEATIESFAWGERDATGDIYYTLAIKEYKKIKTKSATNTVATEQTTTRETKATESKSITVKKDWLEKAKEQSYSMRKRDYALAISFGDGKDYYVIEDTLMEELYKCREALEAIIDGLGGLEDPLVELPDLKASGVRSLIRRKLGQ